MGKVFLVIPASGAPETQEKTVSPGTSLQEVTPDLGKLLSKVTVNAVTAAIDENIQSENIKAGVTILGVGGSYAGDNSKFLMALEGTYTSLPADLFQGVTVLKPYAFTGAFPNIAADSTAYLPDIVTIGERAFYNSLGGGLKHIDIGAGVQSIGAYAFVGNDLIDIYVRAVEPPVLSASDPFNSTNNCPIYVPAGSVDAYKAATNWSTVASRIQAIPE